MPTLKREIVKIVVIRCGTNSSDLRSPHKNLHGPRSV